MRPSANPSGHPRESLAPAAPEPANLIPHPGAPEPPGHLDEVAVGVWNEIWRVGGTSYDPGTDSPIIERYASMQSRRLEALAVIENEGMTTTGSQGQVVLHPLVRVVESIEAKLLPLEDRLGLNPEARIRLGISTLEGKTKLEEFLERRGGDSST